MSSPFSLNNASDNLINQEEMKECQGLRDPDANFSSQMY